jgi:hypothetical protein
MKQSLIFVLIAVLSAGLVFVGCSNDSGSSGSSTAAPDIDGIVIDATVDSQAGLKEALRPDNNFEAIALVLSGGDMTLTDVVVIPQGKTLVLLNTDSIRHSLTPSISGLNIRGSVIVSENTELYVDDDHQVSIWSSGNIQVQARGLLTTDARISVSNYTDAGVSYESVLTKNVSYKGGSTLRITGEGDVFTIADINALLNTLTPGTRAVNAPTGASRLELTAKLALIKPSDVTQLAGISDTRRIRLEPALAEDAATTALTIPAGAEVTTEVDLENIKTITITNGSLSAPKAVFAALTALNVTTGAFVAPVAAPKEEVALAATDSVVTVETIKVVAGSTVTGESDFEYKKIEGDLVTAPGVVINGSEVPEGASKFRTITPTSANTATPTALTLVAGEVVYIEGAYPFTASSVDIPVDATVVVKGTLKVSTTTTMTATTFKGTINVESGGALSDSGHDTLWPTPATGTNPHTGKIVFKVGSEAQQIVSDTTLIQIGGANSNILNLESGTITLRRDSYTLEGRAIVQPNVPGNEIDLIDDSMTITDGSTLIVNSNKNLTVSGNTVTIAPSARIVVNGTFTLKETGTLVNNGAIEVANGGIFDMKAAAAKPGTNNGTITIKSGGTVKGTHGVDLEGDGLFVVEAGGSGYVTPSASSETLLIGGSGSPVFTLTKGTFSFNKTRNILNGEGTLNGPYNVGSDSQVMTITQGSTFTIAATNGNLMLNTANAVVSSGTAGAAKIVLKTNGGKVTFANNASSNFYDASGVRVVTNNIAANGTDETYIWTALSSSVSGWKKE